MTSYAKFETDRRKNKSSYDMTKRAKNQLNKKSKSDEFLDHVIDWVTFYRRNMHRFVEHYFKIDLHLYQKLLLFMMNISTMIVIVACRASAKSYLIAVFACAKAVLYPSSRIVIASSTKKQAKLIVTEKIQKELIPNSVTLAREIKQIRTGNDEIEVIFHNSSSIVVTAANENSRGLRATITIYEEFRMIKKEIIDSVLSPFLYVRQAPFLRKAEYEHLKEEPMEIYISSAWLKQHWMWKHMKLAVASMFNNGDSMLLGFDYSITLKHGIRTRNQLKKEKKKLGATSFAIEYENLMLGETENAYYTFELVNKNRKLKKAFYPRNNIDVLEKKKNKFDIKKVNGEIRIVSVDVSMISGADNDNTSISCIRALPTKDYYERQVPYIEAFNGGNTSEQAIRIKQIFEDFEADYLILDTYNAGISLFDELGKILYDEERDKEYEAWTCFNDEKTAERVKNRNAKAVVFSIKAGAMFNHEMHMTMKDCLEKGRIRLLINSNDAEDLLENKKTNISIEDQVFLELPFVQTDILINEMINLSYEYNENSKTIKLNEPSSGRKDRYISLGYGNYFIQLLERDLSDKEDNSNDFIFAYN